MFTAGVNSFTLATRKIDNKSKMMKMNYNFVMTNKFDKEKKIFIFLSPLIANIPTIFQESLHIKIVIVWEVSFY